MGAGCATGDEVRLAGSRPNAGVFEQLHLQVLDRLGEQGRRRKVVEPRDHLGAGRRDERGVLDAEGSRDQAILDPLERDGPGPARSPSRDARRGLSIALASTTASSAAAKLRKSNQ